ncbi:hypothetical protein EVAR_55290_1 [Eumeta japonica]|uniref:Uncharacterized protein n=1 Tax=Eumeta variegata TaxID=151549 RepID=A0A4C1ZEP3_EUMVA|nr:hypothetical protein EVAR_55290_1 [Eumeta japonica]
MVEWWVAAPSGPEKPDDGEPQRYGKTTTITHFPPVETARLFCITDSGPCRDGRRYSLALNDYSRMIMRATNKQVDTAAHGHSHAHNHRCVADLLHRNRISMERGVD